MEGTAGLSAALGAMGVTRTTFLWPLPSSSHSRETGAPAALAPSAAWPRLSEKHRVEHIAYEPNEDICYCISAPDMGLAPGGRLRQKIYTDQYDFTDWETSISSRCFVHLAKSETWKTITGKYPPTMPLTAMKYSEYGLPWFEYYSDQAALQGSSALSNLQSISSMGKGKKQKPLPENESAEPEKIFKIIRKQTSQRVREWQP